MMIPLPRDDLILVIEETISEFQVHLSHPPTSITSSISLPLCDSKPSIIKQACLLELPESEDPYLAVVVIDQKGKNSKVDYSLKLIHIVVNKSETNLVKNLASSVYTFPLTDFYSITSCSLSDIPLLIRVNQTQTQIS